MTPPRRRLIVNADDLGRTVGINDGIFEAHDRGLVTSATLMVGFDAARDAAARLAERPALGVGLHVTLTGARPTLPARDVPSLVDAAGLLPRKPELVSGFATDDLLREIRNQLRLFRDLTGGPPTHLDSHHHSHRLPVVLAALVEIAEAERLPVRRSSEAVAAALAARGLATTDAFDERFFGADATLATFERILAEAPAGTIEVMCHPGYADDALRAESGYADARRVELAVLTDPRARAAVEAAGLELATFAGLAG